MIQRLRNRQGFDTPIQEQIENPPTVAEELLKALRHWDLLALVKYNPFAYEATVVGLIRYLEPISTRDDIIGYLFQWFEDHTRSSQRTPENVRRIQALAGDMFTGWTAYLQRSGQVAIAELHTRARMRQHYLPRSQSR